MTNRPEKKYWLDEPRNVTKVFYTLVAVCAALLLGDLFYDKHGHFGWEGFFGFHGLYGFFGSVFLVLTAKEVLRRLMKRDEDYYDE